MTIKFYGAINSSGSTYIMRGYSQSNNFKVNHPSTGVYKITLNEWVAEEPIFYVTPITNTMTGQVPTSIAQVGSVEKHFDTWQFTVNTFLQTGSQAPFSDEVSFLFTAVAGSHLVVSAEEGTTFRLQPITTAFGYDRRAILITELWATYQGTTTRYHIDSATRITIVSDNAITVDLGSLPGFSVEAYTYKQGSLEPTSWSDNDNKATLSPPSVGPVTAEYQIAVSATDNSNSGNVLWADPVVRMSKEPPDGIATRTVG